MKVALQGRAQGRQGALYEAAGMTVVEGTCRSEDDLIDLLRDADGAQVGIMPLTSRRVLEACPKLKVVSRFGVGVDSIDIDAATELGVMVCNVPGSNTTEVADHAMALLLSLTRACTMRSPPLAPALGRTIRARCAPTRPACGALPGTRWASSVSAT